MQPKCIDWYGPNTQPVDPRPPGIHCPQGEVPSPDGSHCMKDS